MKTKTIHCESMNVNKIVWSYIGKLNLWLYICNHKLNGYGK